MENEKILFISRSGESLPVAWRLRRMGIDAKVYVHEQRYQTAYSGIMQNVWPKNIREEAESASIIVFDLFETKGTNLFKWMTMSQLYESKRIINLSDWLDDFDIVQNRYLMDGDLGPSVAAQGTMVRFDPGSRSAQPNRKIIPTGDAIYAMLELTKDGFEDLFYSNERTFVDSWCCCQRYSVPPYPYISDDLMVMADVLIAANVEEIQNFWAQDIVRDEMGHYRCGGIDGLLGVVTGVGQTPEEGWGKCYSNIRKIRLAGARPQYRKDGLKSATRFQRASVLAGD